MVLALVSDPGELKSTTAVVGAQACEPPCDVVSTPRNKQHMASICLVADRSRCLPDSAAEMA
ncbi:hypothetical protein BAUCODRAFT_332532 [Baudoinia panamericana UAMH 10762]|uniref:Uncharacterized protein n=1 Tax=Baudoinia panamericana (strain UAMH 10762) TaxID=717646 RepID=M2MWK5_BAUPA|nr:uncharacterized protein BAUCODRAFT_332532 [Baudoinia panamericana UAMH 10762]EMC90969.1 hypothetical protein BAUCODRAFT_332532 [Baudoinia panamericana UAMH 10762]